MTMTHTGRIALTFAVAAAGAGAASAPDAEATPQHAQVTHVAKFPAPMVPFMIRTGLSDGHTVCATRETRDPAHVMLRACSNSNRAQHWQRRTVDANGYGIVYGLDGSCITSVAILLTSKLCRKIVAPASLSWKLLPDGKVRNAVNGVDTVYWSTSGANTDRPTLSRVSNPKFGARFSMPVISTLP
ncbi:hypothetical protein [Actinomadura harenae]|uniref:Uncharacterized protein n=1 Tax=Actinomadura harenae TaxID=2483351 RepID=A0A3M2LZU8_9ACTN|nr:hypothetical protein [Actinomadura harenae]RMI42113.1 hypothetical protein EBO15_20915 [Actinomadura harenae]